ncbi:hypothetical protein [Paenibacillus cremeus]|uniref:Uncharacterized protein n=1 Tax=Paenibacillus cremeus TaxID=2163881 RepID=A0A559K078_9BACL|nr:hypothetical protein [Paenibacillus cremeus]TVY05497.1 hypothetical protein FPZ49_29825 [Paenibacillus cremeus]
MAQKDGKDKDKVELQGRVAFDVENREWVMWDETAFIGMEELYAGINAFLKLRQLPPLKVGDEISLTVKRG